MRFSRFSFRVLPTVVGLSLLTGACGAPLALTAASYGADGVSLAETDKTMADHFVSMVSKKDCALWRMFRDQDVCRPRDGGHDPYDINYTEPFRQPGEGGVEYAPPLRAAADAPLTSWDPQAYVEPDSKAGPAPTTPAKKKQAVKDAPDRAATVL